MQISALEGLNTSKCLKDQKRAEEIAPPMYGWKLVTTKIDPNVGIKVVSIYDQSEWKIGVWRNNADELKQQRSRRKNIGFHCSEFVHKLTVIPGMPTLIARVEYNELLTHNFAGLTANCMRVVDLYMIDGPDMDRELIKIVIPLIPVQDIEQFVHKANISLIKGDVYSPLPQHADFCQETDHLDEDTRTAIARLLPISSEHITELIKIMINIAFTGRYGSAGGSILLRALRKVFYSSEEEGSFQQRLLHRIDVFVEQSLQGYLLRQPVLASVDETRSLFPKAEVIKRLRLTEEFRS